MSAILALAHKDLRLLVRDKGGAFFVFVFPLIIALFFGVIFGSDEGPSGIKIAIVDLDKTDASESFITSIEAGKEFVVSRMATEAEAENVVRRGRQAASVVLQPGFGAARERIFWGDPMTITLGIDPARSAESAMIEGLLTAKAFEGMQEIFSKPQKMQESMDDAIKSLAADSDMPLAQKAILNTFLAGSKTFFGEFDFEPTGQSVTGGEQASPMAGWQPIRIDTHQVGAAGGAAGAAQPRSFEVSFPQGIMWGILGCSAAFGISLVSERLRGTLVRLRMAPLTSRQVLAGKGLACFTAICLITTVLLTIGWMIEVRVSSLGLLALGVVSIAMCFVGIMMLMSVLGKTEQAAGGIGWMANTIMAMLGGGMIPLFIMPKWMQTLSSISPVKWAILALEGGTWRGFSAMEMALPCGILIAVGVVGFLVGSGIYTRRVA